MRGAVPQLPQYGFMAWCLVKHMGNFIFSPALGSTHPPERCVPVALYQGLRRPGREADHLHPSSAEFKYPRSYTSSPPYVFLALCLIKHWVHLYDVVLR